MTRLAILADTRHFRSGKDLYVLSRVAAQLDQLGSLFDDAIACVPVYPGAPPANFEPYLRNRVTAVPLKPGGGTTIKDKLALGIRAVTWIPRLRRVARKAGFAHFRCPCNVALVALLVVPSSIPWYAMYAGSWEGYAGEPWSYRLQRWLLRRRRNGVVTAYMAHADAALPHVVPFFSPTHTAEELAEEASAVRPTIDSLLKGHMPSPLKAVSVGHLTENKNHATTIRAVALARGWGAEIELDVAGAGGLFDDLRTLADNLGLGAAARLHGLLSRDALRRLYRQAHVNVLVSRTEGYPKVILEGMAAGAVPVVARFAMAPELTGYGTRGVTVDSDDVEDLARALVSLAKDPRRLGTMAEACLTYADAHSLDAFGDELARIFAERWPETFAQRKSRFGG